MPSKLFKNLTFLLAISFVVASCQLDTDDGTPSDVLELKGGHSLSCINSDISPFLKNGLKKTTDQTVKAAFGCLNYIVEVVNKHINVESKTDIDIFSIKDLLKRKVEDYNKNTEKIVDIFFEIKVKSVKGQVDSVSHDELGALQVFIRRLEHLYLEVYPLVNLSLDKGSSKHLSDHLIARQLKQTRRSILNLFADYELTISKEDLERWLSSADVLRSDENQNKWGLYWSFHELMWSAQKNSLSYLNIELWSQNMADYMRLVLNTKYSWTLKKYFSGEQTEQVLAVVDRLFHSLESSIKNSKERLLSYESLNKALYYYERLNGLPRGLQLSTLQRMIPIVIEKLVSVPEEIRKTPGYMNKVYMGDFQSYYPGFNEQHFKNLKKEFDIYKQTQLAISRSQINPNSSLRPLGPRGEIPFVNIIQNIDTYFSSAHEGLVVESLGSTNKYNPKNLSMINILRSFARAVAMGYNTSTRRKNIYEGIYRKQLGQFIYEFADVFNELYIMAVGKSRVDDIVERMYIESKIFVTSGDGFDQVKNSQHSKYSIIKMTEAIEVIAHYTSSIISLPKTYLKLKSKCEKIEENHDVFDLPAIPRSCFNSHYLNMVANEFNNLPHLQDYLKGYFAQRQAEPEEGFSFEDSLIYTVKTLDDSTDTFITYTEYSKLGTLLVFIETMFLKFDEDQNHFIDKSEVDQSYIFFKELISARSYIASYCTEISYKKLLTQMPGSGVKNFGGCVADFSSRRIKSAVRGLQGVWNRWFGDKNTDRELPKTKRLINKNDEVSVGRHDVLKVLGFFKDSGH